MVSYQYKESIKKCIDENYVKGYPAHQNRIEELNKIYLKAEKYDTLMPLEEINDEIYRKANSYDQMMSDSP